MLSEFRTAQSPAHTLYVNPWAPTTIKRRKTYDPLRYNIFTQNVALMGLHEGSGHAAAATAVE